MTDEEVHGYKAEDKDGETKASVSEHGGVCGYFFGDVDMAKGYSMLGPARGTIIMSTIFLSTALIFLASEHVGCIEELDGKEKAREDCQERVWGLFTPAALITNTATVSGLLSALLMPVAGAIVDYTSHRWTTGVVTAVLLTLIQIAQIGTNSYTWFLMAVLQAIMGLLYHVQVLATYSYLPDMSRVVDERTWTSFTSTFTMLQFGGQSLFLVTVVAISIGLGLDDVTTAQTSQAISAVFAILGFVPGWLYMPKVPARNVLGEGKSLILEGFAQNWRTWKQINQQYKRSLRWFLLGVLFAEPACNAFTVVSVVYLNDQLGMSGKEIGVMLLVCLLAMIPGGLIFYFVAHRTDPNTSLCFSMFMLFVLCVIGALTLTPDNTFPWVYVWGAGLGLMLGCYYPSIKIFLSLVVPHGQEAEVTGFYVYCSQILVWLPPLIYSLMVEAHVDQSIGLIALGGFSLVSIFFFQMAAPFPELLDEIHNKEKLETWQKLKAQSPKVAPLDASSGTLT